MRTLPLVLLAVAALLVPTGALAGGSATSTARYFVITGMVLGDQKAEASGKLSIDGSQLSASVGCNLIGGKVSVDGDTLTISEPLAMTEMACSGTSGDLEAMLIKVLQHGPFTISDGAWSGDGAALIVQEVVASTPDPNAPAPDEPVGGSPVAVIVDPAFSCPPYALPSGDPGVINGTVQPDGGAVSAGGSGSSDGSTGSGGSPDDATSGSGGDGSGTATSSTAIAEPGATPGEEPPAPPIAPEPGQTFDVGQKHPEPSAVIVEPAPSAIVAPDPGTVTDPGPSVDPGSSVDIDPGFGGQPVPVDPCAERMYAVDQGNAAGGPGLQPPKSGDAAEHAASTSNPNAPLVALGLALMVVAALAAGTLRRRQARPSVNVASPPSGERLTEEPGPTPR